MRLRKMYQSVGFLLNCASGGGGLSGFSLIVVPLIVIMSRSVNSKYVDVATDSKQIAQNFGTLQLVQVIFRHGERNPLESLGPLYPNDIDDFPNGWGQLTKKGEEQGLKLGEYLRQRYAGFFNPEYRSEEITALSSDLDRTIRTGLQVLKGLYPQVSLQKGANPSCHLHPESQLVPIRTLDPVRDNILHYSMDCPKFKKLNLDFWPQSKTIKKIEAENKDQLELLKKATGRKARNWNDVMYVIDYIKVMIHQNRSLPSWVTREMMQVLNEYQSERVSLFLGTRELKRFRSPLIRKLIGNMENKTIEGDRSKRKIYLFSAHDLTLLTVLNVLGFQVNQLPPYTSSIFIELHKNPQIDDYHVEIYFRNETKGTDWRDPFKMSIPSCSSPCLLGQLIDLMTPLYIQNYEMECQLTSTSTLTSTSSAPLAIGFNCILLISCFFKLI